MTNYVISYDVSEDSLRVAVAKVLLARGCKRVQKSVFMGVGFGVEEIRGLEGELGRILRGSAVGNSVFCMSVSKEQLLGMVWIGRGLGDLLEGEEFVLV